MRERNEMPWEKVRAFKTIVIEYSGSGDEGYINEITPEPEVEGMEISSELYYELERAAYDILSDHFGGWEINEGSAGTMTLNINDGTVSVHHGWTVETTEYEDKEIG